jgi:hypothetical protein
MSFKAFWWLVLKRAWREAWSLVVQHSVKAVLRNIAIFLAACFAFYYFQGDLVKLSLTSPENLSDTVAWAVMILIVSILIFLVVFAVMTIFIVPYQMWSELKAQLTYVDSEHADTVGEWQSGQWEVVYPRRQDNHPNWTIRELFYHVDPNVLDHWEDVAAKIRDQLSLGQLRSWGRKGVQTPIDRECGIGPAPLTEIYSGYWESAGFTYCFFDEGKPSTEEPHTYVLSGNLPIYSDVQVNYSQALRIWPKAESTNDMA